MTRHLIRTNVLWLRKALHLLSQISNDVYAQSPAGCEPHRVGGHVRHILEFYECFLDGLASRCIDYDARKRDRRIQEGREYAMGVIRAVIHRLESSVDMKRSRALWVRMEDACDSGIQDPFLASSVERELQVLSSHTIHHFALIAMTLKSHGVTLDQDFGMAPSTLRHLANSERSQQCAGAAACVR